MMTNQRKIFTPRFIWGDFVTFDNTGIVMSDGQQLMETMNILMSRPLLLELDRTIHEQLSEEAEGD